MEVDVVLVFPNGVFVVGAEDRPKAPVVGPDCVCPKGLGRAAADCPKGLADGAAAGNDG